MLAALGFLIVAATAIGSVNVPLAETFNIILKQFGITQGEYPNERIIIYVRLPRVILAAIVGAALSMSGVVMQGMFRNPMADPGILGVSSGAGVGAVTAIALGLTIRSIFFLPLFSSVGSLVAAFIIFVLSARDGKISVVNLVLCGMAVSMFLGSLTTMILSFFRSDHVKQFILWTSGSLSNTMWEDVRLIIIPVAICGLAFMFLSKELNVMLLGEEEAQSVGLNIGRTRKLLLALTSIITASAVSVSGTISFVGLIVPHMLRIIVGPDHRTLLPASAVGGAVFLVFCDLVGRTVIPMHEINVGVVTSLLGAPYFIYLLNRARKYGKIF